MGEPQRGTIDIRIVSRLMISQHEIHAITAGASRTNRLKQAIMVAGYKEMLCVRLIHTRNE